MLFSLCCVASLFSGHRAQAESASRLSYAFRLASGPVIQVTATLQTSEQSITELRLAKEWGGVINDGSDVSNLQIESSDGSNVEVKQTSPVEWTVSHEPNTLLHMRYEVLPKESRGAIRGNDYRTQMETKLFQMIGHLGLLAPKPIENAPEAVETFRVAFTGFQDQNWTVMSSFGSGEGPFEFTGKLSEFLHSVIMAGDIQSIVRDVSGNQVGIAIAGSSWQFTPNELADLVAKVVQAERDFFDDHTDKWYLVTLTPVPQSSPQATSLGGTALTNAFSLFCTTNFTLSSGSDQPMKALWLLAHEYFHQWNGNKIPTAGDDPSTYWFSEGFTNYYARKILLRSGLITPNEFVADLNNALRLYDEIPLRLADNDKIRAGFWTNQDAQQLPYQRGDMLALMLDEHIQSKTGGKQSLDDFLLDLFRNRPTGGPVTSELLFSRLQSLVDQEVISHVRDSVLQGGNVSIPKSISEPRLELAKGQLQSYEPGFDFEKSRQSKRIVGVIESSNAYQAGVREDQPIRRFSVDSAANPPIAELTVIENGVEKQTRYEALSAPREVRLYRPAKDE